MENLELHLASAPQAHARAPVLVGVVASGNCEVLIEREAPAASAPPAVSACAFHVHTSALGFAPIWHAVLGDFAERRAVGGLRIEINDVGATPAIVSLRLEQGIEAWEEGHA